MKKYLRLVLFLLSFTAFFACEDLIELEVNDAPPALVIVGEVTNQEVSHEVRVHRTVPVSSTSQFDPVSRAAVSLTDSLGRRFAFSEVEPGLYRSQPFRGRVGMQYQLQVEVENVIYEATSKMPRQVPVDSIGTATSNFPGNDNIYITMKFMDPIGEPNFYRYIMSINESPYIYMSVFDDKFNDGRMVTHELINFDVELKKEDMVRVRRQYISQDVYSFWQVVSSANPGASSPANPPSNFTNGALGYFSAHSFNEYSIYVP